MTTLGTIVASMVLTAHGMCFIGIDRYRY